MATPYAPSQESQPISDYAPRSEHRIELAVPGVDAFIEVSRVDGVDALSEPFQFIVELKAHSELAVNELVGRKASLELVTRVAPLWPPHGSPPDGDESVVMYNWSEQATVLRRVSGIVFSAEALPEPRAYRVALVHPLMTLSLNRSMRIYQDKSAIEVVREVLDRNGIPVSTKLLGSYERRDYCVQYRETDFHFISRLLEEEGVAYHFELRGGESRMLLTDDPSAFAPLPAQSTVVFRQFDGLVQHTESIHALREHRELRPSRVSLADRNPRRPLLELAAEDRGASEDPGDVYDFFGKFGQSERAQRLARVRREEIDVSRHFLSVASNSVRLTPGRVVRLVDHPIERMNGEHLIVRVEHSAMEPLYHEGGIAHYSNVVTLLPLDAGGRRRAFRPSRVTPRPIALGVHTATVDGQGQEVCVDDLGRVKVRFHWDREGMGSYWIRVSEGWAGVGYGTMFLPRDGQEVLVSFLEGDPDHPIIVGRVYNATQPLPDAQGGSPREHPTVSVIRTRSVGGQGYNELSFEDRAGDELVQVHGHKRIRLQAGERIRVEAGERIELEGGAPISLVVGGVRLEVRSDGVFINDEKVCTGGH
jgi:type VI secretion system secreted protein VgrG